jgi:hypothetical protein
MYLLVNGFGDNGPKIRRTRVDPPLNESSKVSDLRSRVAGILDKKTDAFILMHCGVSLLSNNLHKSTFLVLSKVFKCNS